MKFSPFSVELNISNSKSESELESEKDMPFFDFCFFFFCFSARLIRLTTCWIFFLFFFVFFWSFLSSSSLLDWWFCALISTTQSFLYLPELLCVFELIFNSFCRFSNVSKFQIQLFSRVAFFFFMVHVLFYQVNYPKARQSLCPPPWNDC